MRMSNRIHVVLDPAEKERFRRVAEREGKTLSEWLRNLARAHVEAHEARPRLDTPEALKAFFAECDERAGGGREPDWEEHLQVIRTSRMKGLPDP